MAPISSRVGILDALNGWVEEIGSAPERRVELGAVLAAVHVLRTERGQQLLHGIHFLDRGHVAGNRTDASAGGRGDSGLDRGKGITPGGGLQATVAAHVRTVQTLGLQAIPDEAGLVGDPLLVHLLVDTRHDAHDFAATGIDADRRTDGIHDVDRFGLAEFPRTGGESEGTRGQRTDRAEVDDVALQLGGHRLLEIGGDFRILTTADETKFGNAGDFRRERTQRVQWMQRFITVLTSGPIYLSSTARLFSV